MSKSTNKPTTAFWIISVVALLWNLMGVFAYLGQAYMTDEVLATLPEPEQLYHEGVAAWATAAYATAVFGGTLGCIALLMRKKWASTLLLISLFAVLAQASYNFFIQEFMPIEQTHMIWSFVIIVIAALLVWFSNNATKKGWIS
jgi:hypothetical protein